METETIFEAVELESETLAGLNLPPFWLSESPAFDDDPYWGVQAESLGGKALFVSGPSRNGNHLIHSMLDGHPDLCSVPGEDSFLTAFFQDLVDDRETALARLRGRDTVEYILHLTGWGINKWKSLWELEQKGGKTNMWSGIQPQGQGYVTDYQDTVIHVDYPAYEARLREQTPAIRKASTFIAVLWLDMDALRLLAPRQGGKICPYCWVGSGMRRARGFLFPRTPLICCIAPLRPFETFNFSFAKGTFPDH